MNLFLRISIVLTAMLVLGLALWSVLIKFHHDPQQNTAQAIDNKYWTKIAAASSYSIAVDEEENIWGWGLNWYGVLGSDDMEARFFAPKELSRGYNLKKIACGYFHIATLGGGGYLDVWGSNEYGQLGLGYDLSTGTISSHIINPYTSRSETVGDDPATPGLDNTTFTWYDVAFGYGQTVGVRDDNTLWSWGANWYGQLGLGDTVSCTVPTQVGQDDNWKSVACGWFHTLAIKTDGTLWAWGHNGCNQLGIADTTAIIHTSPVQVSRDNDWKEISCGYDHSLAIKTDGSLWTWGNNEDGQLGVGDTITRTLPTRVAKGTKWKQAVCGGDYSAAIRDDNTLWVWGDSEWGVLGQGYNAQDKLQCRMVTMCSRTFTASDKEGKTTYYKAPKYYLDSPTQVGADRDWKQVACGECHVLALKTDGKLWGWGHNDEGQLGLGQEIPTPIFINRR